MYRRLLTTAVLFLLLGGQYLFAGEIRERFEKQNGGIDKN
jgi:hypothetical protein